MSRHIQKIIELRKKNEHRKKATEMIMINEYDKIVEMSNRNHVRFYNFEKKNWFIQDEKQTLNRNIKTNEWIYWKNHEWLSFYCFEFRCSITYMQNENTKNVRMSKH